MTFSARPNPNVFANNPLDRAAHHRTDEAWIESALNAADSQLMLFDQKRQLMVEDEAVSERGIKWMKGSARMLFGPDAPLLFLGIGDGKPHFAMGAPKSADLDAIPLSGEFVDLRSAATKLNPDEAAIAGTAAWLLDWHARHGYCARCGVQSIMTDAGWKRVCLGCAAEHFPRVDPVAIMLGLRDDRCLLGRQAGFPKGMYSALAGFVEPGETVEEACVRELFEEAGISAKAEQVQYLFAQPWPFPCSLMFGLHVAADSEQINVDATELEHAQWFTRAEVKAMCEGGLETPDGPLFVPPGMAIARRIIEEWLAGEVANASQKPL